MQRELPQHTDPHISQEAFDAYMGGATAVAQITVLDPCEFDEVPGYHMRIGPRLVAGGRAALTSIRRYRKLVGICDADFATVSLYFWLGVFATPAWTIGSMGS